MGYIYIQTSVLEEVKCQNNKILTAESQSMSHDTPVASRSRDSYLWRVDKWLTNQHTSNYENPHFLFNKQVINDNTINLPLELYWYRYLDLSV